ncbi:hypothetical protein Lpp219_12837 [Lacticaseibacillus paracasei subsp. paracasei Lpp219]|nr:hypothetical protein Lpp219_12837 [Lacticaseibacillus paracasei subsp. paracasei Lpp219]
MRFRIQCGVASQLFTMQKVPFHHEEKTILFTIISRAEMYDLEQAMRHSDPYAFVSITDSVKILGHFYEPKTD